MGGSEPLGGSRWWSWGQRTGNHRIEDDGERGSRGGRACDVLGEVVVVLDGFEGDGLAVEAEVVDRDGEGEQRLDCCVAGGVLVSTQYPRVFVHRGEHRQGGSQSIPSTMPSPDLKIGTIETVSGAMVVVSYSKPSGVLSCPHRHTHISAGCSYYSHMSRHITIPVGSGNGGASAPLGPARQTRRSPAPRSPLSARSHGPAP